jgi:hypothetical protein
MQLVHCDGCGRSEEVGIPRDESVMEHTAVMIAADPRSWVDNKSNTFEADLCDRCRVKLLHTFFKVPSDTDPELPSFLSAPTSALGV